MGFFFFLYCYPDTILKISIGNCARSFSSVMCLCLFLSFFFFLGGGRKGWWDHFMSLLGKKKKNNPKNPTRLSFQTMQSPWKQRTQRLVACQVKSAVAVLGYSTTGSIEPDCFSQPTLDILLTAKRDHSLDTRRH